MPRHPLVLAVVLVLATWARSLRAQASSDCEAARVRQELDGRYAQLADANRRKDLDSLLALRARDYVADLPDGTQSNYSAGRELLACSVRAGAENREPQQYNSKAESQRR